MSIIGAGLGRTGTASLKAALEQLGFSPCYHGEHAMSSSAALSHWEEAIDSGTTNWEQVFRGYRATTDLPAALFYRQLSEYYPTAKVILTTREPNAWFASTQIWSPAAIEVWKKFPCWSMLLKLAARMQRELYAGSSDRASAIAGYERYNLEVQALIPSERLLVYEVGQGWEPLCRFLDVPVPNTNFPRLNSKRDAPKDPRLLREVLVDMHAGCCDLLSDAYAKREQH